MTLREKGPVSPRSSWRRARGWLPLLGLLFLGWTSSARAEASPRCAVLPLRVPGSGAEEAERLDLLLREEADRVTRAEGLGLVAADLTTQALEAQGRESCFEEDACLGRVARGTGAQCTVAVALSAFNRQLRVSARVVDGQGAEVAPGLVREVRPTARVSDAGAREALAAALRRLDWKAVRERAAAAVPPPLPPRPVEVAKHARPPAVTGAPPGPAAPFPVLRVASYALGGAGLVALGAGGAMHLGAGRDARHLRELLAAGAHGGEARALQARLAQRERTVPLLVAGGAAAVVAGGVLWLLAPADGPAVAVLPRADGAALQLGGRFE